MYGKINAEYDKFAAKAGEGYTCSCIINVGSVRKLGRRAVLTVSHYAPRSQHPNRKCF